MDLKAKIKGKLNDQPFFCSSQNISVSGLLIETDKALQRSDVLSCTFYLPGFGQIIADAEVVRIVNGTGSSFQYGIRYLNLSTSFRVAIEEFIVRRSVKK